MTNITLVAHHGSPGHPDDFSHMQRHLPPQAKVIPLQRGRNVTVVDGMRIELGYSFGCLSALKSALENDVNVVVLVAPFLFPSERPSNLKRRLVKTPGVGALLLGIAGPSGIEKMLVQSSSPAQVPENDRQDAINYMIP